MLTLLPTLLIAQFKREGAPERVEISGLQESGTRQAKSPFLGVALSLILPGAGEWYADNFSTGQYFLGADAALWVTYTGISLRGTWVRDDARAFATVHAGALVGGKDEQFEVDLGNFRTTDEYNQAKLRNREYDLLYEESSFQWRWDSEDNRVAYRELRIQSDQLFQNSRFVLGALVLNRVISAFSAWRSVNRYNRAGASGSWGIGAGVQNGPLRSSGISLRITKSF